jgi:hypothetical protein
MFGKSADLMPPRNSCMKCGPMAVEAPTVSHRR